MIATAQPVIRVDGVSRWFGSVVAVSDVSFDITPGITGLLGPNGAGKTTLFRMMTGLAGVSSGTITVFGEPVRDNPPLYRRLGVMSEHETVYAMTVHKTQGSEFARILLLLPDRPSPLINRALLYTAVTRAKQAVRVYGSERLLLDAL